MTFIRKIKRGKHTYLAEVENAWVNGKVVQKHIRYVGKEVDGKKVLSGSIDRAQIDKVLIYGPLLIVDAVAKELGLSELLGEYGDLLLSLAYGHCIDPGSVRKLTQWFERTDIHSLLDIPEVTYKKLLEALDSLEQRDGDVIQQKIFRRLQERLQLRPEGYFYDITSIYFYGVKCPLAKKKKKPKSRDLPQIQVGLAVTKEDGIPIFHKVFEGNIADTRTLSDLLLLFEEYDVKHATLIWDRGVSSEKNIRDAQNLGFDVLCGLPLQSNLKQVAKKVLSAEEFTSMRYRVRLRNATFYVRRMPYIHRGIKGYLYICLNEREKQRTKERRYDEIDKALEARAEKKALPRPGIRKYLKGRGFNHAAIKQAEQFDGVSAIFSTKRVTCKETVYAYFEKDRVEKAFRTLKGLLEMDKIRFWLKGKVKGHIFVCYLSYLLMSLLDYKLKATKINATDALELMQSMYKVHISDPKTKNKFVKTVVLSTKQEKILKAIDEKLLQT
jgi:transposase